MLLAGSSVTHSHTHMVTTHTPTHTHMVTTHTHLHTHGHNIHTHTHTRSQHTHSHTHSQLRDRSFTAPQRPIQIANEPLSSAGTPHYSKQISSPPTSSPSAYHPPHTSHTPLVQTASVPASRRGVFPSPGTPGLRGQKGGRIGFGHQESEYGELEFQGVTELLSDHDLFQEQSERYQRIEKAMMRTSKGVLVCVCVCCVCVCVWYVCVCVLAFIT